MISRLWSVFYHEQWWASKFAQVFDCMWSKIALCTHCSLHTNCILLLTQIIQYLAIHSFEYYLVGNIQICFEWEQGIMETSAFIKISKTMTHSHWCVLHIPSQSMSKRWLLTAMPFQVGLIYLICLLKGQVQAGLEPRIQLTCTR